MKTVAPFVLFLLIAISSFSQTFKQPHISVSGKAEIEVEPDIINVRIILSENDGNKKMTIQQKEKVLMGILSDLKIDQKRLTLLDALSHFDRNFWKKDEVKTSKTFNLKLSDAKTLNQVMLALRDKGLSGASISSVDHSRKTELMKEARIKAIKAAKEKASYLTEAIGQKVGKALSITEARLTWPRQMAMANSVTNYAATLNDSLPEISFKKIKITANVSAVFEIL